MIITYEDINLNLMNKMLEIPNADFASALFENPPKNKAEVLVTVAREVQLMSFDQRKKFHQEIMWAVKETEHLSILEEFLSEMQYYADEEITRRFRLEKETK